MNNKKFNILLNTPLSECKRDIKELAHLKEGNDYNSLICDYSIEKKAITNRFIEPYITSNVHGSVFNDFPKLIKNLKVNRLLDLGCGAGELLHILKSDNPMLELYGVTIHLGEVKYARENYHLNNVLPIDMREINEYFDINFFDCIIAHCSFNFIPINERIDIVKESHKLLNKDGYFIFVDYKGIDETKLPDWNYSEYYKIISLDYKIKTMGNLTIYKKI